MGKQVHILLSVDESSKTGVCAKCGPVRLKRKNQGPGRGYRWACLIAAKQWTGTAYKKGVAMNAMNNDEMAYYLARCAGSCDICGRTPRRMLDRDHCHVTGKFRGLLCNRCNTLLGKVDEDIDKLRDKAELFNKAADYLERTGNTMFQLSSMAERSPVKTGDVCSTHTVGAKFDVPRSFNGRTTDSDSVN
jgi:Recombination endonuclease VII